MTVNCTQLDRTVNTSIECSLFSQAIGYSIHSTGNCTTLPYTGSVCRLQLALWQECAIGEAESVFLDAMLVEQSLEEKERDVAQFLHFLREFTLIVIASYKLSSSNESS